MANNLSPTSFRVYDKQEKRYLEDDDTKTSYELDRHGNLTKWVESESPDGGYQPHDLDLKRYVVERFTGCFDLDKRPIYVGDAVHFLRYDANNQLERIKYCYKHPGISDTELDKAIPPVIYHLIRGIKEGDGDFDTFCLSSNDSMFMGHKAYRKYRNGFRVVGNVHEPYADITARVPEYRDYLAGTEIDQNKVNERGNG